MARSKTILLGVCGGVAAYKSAYLIRLLKKVGHQVYVIPTESASQFIGHKTFQALSGQPVIDETLSFAQGDGMLHIELTRKADLLLIAPATANTIAKIANGIADNLLLEMVLARTIPLLIAPAMNVHMWQQAANQRNIAYLRETGVLIADPLLGELACGEVGQGRMLEPEQLMELIEEQLSPKILKDKKVLITAGGTREMIDPMRCLTNLSSGKMGIAMARACRNAGAQVTLVHAQITQTIPHGLHEVVYADSTQAMYQAVHQRVADQDVFIAVAAVSDFRPKEVLSHKIKKRYGEDHESLTLELERTPDILASVAALDDEPFCVGFAAESERVLEYAQQKKEQKGIPLLIANQINESVGEDISSVYILGDKGNFAIKQREKTLIAQEIVNVIAEYLN
jgi:phosphopantothenoylcysteine decarboxylase/phosphopantothenate--cysteine ligase